MGHRFISYGIPRLIMLPFDTDIGLGRPLRQAASQDYANGVIPIEKGNDLAR
jgi:hypothetical protein